MAENYSGSELRITDEAMELNLSTTPAVTPLLDDLFLADPPILLPVAGDEESFLHSVKVYRERWLMLGLFCGSTATSAMLWITFAPIASLTQIFYGVSSNYVNALSIVYMAAYMPMTVVSSWSFQRIGMRHGIILGSALNFSSALLRFLSTLMGGYPVLLVGQILGALGQPFLTNLPAKMASVWFGSEERDLACVLGFLANLMGTAIGSVLPVLFTYTYDHQSIQMFGLLLTEFIIAMGVLVLVALFVKEKPLTPPSASESNRQHEGHAVMQEIQILLKNKDFMLLVLSVGVFAFGLTNCLVTVLEQLITPVGYTSDDASLFSGLTITCGIICSVFVGVALDKTHRYNEFLKVTLCASAFSLLLLLLSIRPNNIVLLCILSGFMGMSMISLMPVALECACETTYPISEDLSSGILLSAGQISGIIYTLCVNTLIDRQPDYVHYKFEKSYVLLFTSTLASVTIGYFYRGKYRRLEAEERTD
mmetsp:Transcript_26638/g.48344  ORF Transcript_26638/g.48344 Transcript_26638/m.48344 type:complete len:480 (-) Transcript_26638:3219-4658(-)